MITCLKITYNVISPYAWLDHQHHNDKMPKVELSSRAVTSIRSHADEHLLSLTFQGILFPLMSTCSI